MMNESIVKSQNSDHLSTGFLVVDRVENELRREISAHPAGTGIQLPHERVLSEKYGVSRKSVRIALDRLRQDHVIRSIPGKGTFVIPSARKTRDVHIICRFPHNPFSMMTIATAGSLLKKRGYSTNLVVTEDPVADWDKIHQSRPDACGTILTGGEYPRPMMEQLAAKSDIPLVNIGDINESFRGLPVCDCVLGDNAAMANQATQYLIRQGHRRIAFIGWNLDAIWYRDTIRGYTDALRAHGIEPDPTWVVDLPATPFFESGGKAEYHAPSQRVKQQVDDWFARDNVPTALVHSAATETGLRDNLHYYFHDHFKNDAIVGILVIELLQSMYTGFSEATAICFKYENIVSRAIDLLFRSRTPGETPRQEILQQNYLYRRINGVWQEIK